MKEKKTTMTVRPISTGQLPRLPPRMLSRTRPKKPSGTSSGRGRDRVRAHTGGSGAVCGIPETFVGTPAVIACTTSCCVVCLRS